VSSLEAVDSGSVEFSKSSRFIWTNEKNRPQFSINVPDRLHVTSDEQITITPINFDFSDSDGYRYEFVLSPEEEILDPSKV